jgi:Uma2 family endonuclease
MTTRARLTLDEFLALPETEPASEYLCDEVVPKPMPSGIHAVLQRILTMLIWSVAGPGRLGQVGSEWRCVFGPPGGERAFVPDVVFILRERLAPGRAGLAGTFRAAPDLAVEILSPEQPVARFVAKVQFYLRHGVRLVWVVDPDAETVTVFAPDRDAVTLRGADVLDGADLLPGFQTTVAAIFAELDG